MVRLCQKFWLDNWGGQFSSPRLGDTLLLLSGMLEFLRKHFSSGILGLENEINEPKAAIKTPDWKSTWNDYCR